MLVYWRVPRPSKNGDVPVPYDKLPGTLPAISKSGQVLITCQVTP